MTALALALALQGPQPAQPWRLVDHPDLHVGIRPALYLDNEARGALEVGAGVTVQVTWHWFGAPAGSR